MAITLAERGLSSSIISPTYWPAPRMSTTNSLPLGSLSTTLTLPLRIRNRLSAASPCLISTPSAGSARVCQRAPRLRSSASGRP